MNERRLGLNGSTIKIIALITMFIDHFGGSVFDRLCAIDMLTWHTPYVICRAIGRLAFPLYCFLLVEGFLHTRSVAKYARNLFLFALISEIPFNLALYNSVIQLDVRFFLHGWFRGTHQNVFFTLLIGLLMMAAIRQAYEKENWNPACRFLVYPIAFGAGALAVHALATSQAGKLISLVPYTPRFYLMAVLAGAGAAAVAAVLGKNTAPDRKISVALSTLAILIAYLAAGWFCVDYRGFGILAIAACYLLRNRSRVLGFALACLILTIMDPLEAWSMPGLVLIALYNGRRGFGGKYFFYVFYPLHLAVLYLVCILLKIT